MDVPRRLRIAITTMIVLFTLGVLALSALTINPDLGDQHVASTDLVLGWLDVVCLGAGAWALDRKRLWGLVPTGVTFLIQLVEWQRKGIENPLSVPVFLLLAYLLLHRTSRRTYRLWRDGAAPMTGAPAYE